MIYLLSEQRLKKDFLNDNIASELILPSIQTAQDIYLRQTLGDSLLDKICSLVRENELEEPYKTLLDDYIIIYLEYLAMAELCVPSTFKLGNIGVAQTYDSNVNTSTIQNVKYLESYYKQKASFYENRLTTFIQQHCNLFPEYNTITDVTVSSESTLQCGIYLGGTSKKRTIINNSNNNNTEVGNYVRYDKAQNLSELEKAQARENIGVSASGEITVDLENYYKKNETYSKNEVDNLIENVDVDLSNYYTKEQVYNKQETYSVSQIDTLISQVPTFSGNYNDLTNKPELFSGSYNDLSDKPSIPTDTSQLTKSDIYTKAETFTRDEIVNMINEINYSDINNTPTLSTVATSGSYNDLTDKPQIYTTEQVYTKSEIDTQISNLSNQIGNINNLLETI